jgi:PAS domain-containing protein
MSRGLTIQKKIDTLSVHFFIYLLIGVILALSLTLVGFVYWQEATHHRNETISTRYHLDNLRYGIQIKAELQRILTLYAQEQVHKSHPGQENHHQMYHRDHTHILNEVFQKILSLQDQFMEHAAEHPELNPVLDNAKEQINLIRVKWQQSEASSHRRLVFLDSIAEILPSFIMTMDQFQRLHINHQRQLSSEMVKTRSEHRINLIVFLIFILMLGLVLTRTILRLIEKLTSRRKQAEKNLHQANKLLAQSENQLRSILTNTTQVVFLKDLEGRYQMSEWPCLHSRKHR